MPRPVHLAGQRLRRRPDKCDAGCRRHKLHITRFRRCRRRKLAHSAAPPSSHRNRFAGFRRESCWEVIKTPVLHFFGVPAWGGITTLGARFMPLKRWTPAGHDGVFAVFMLPRNSPCVGRISPRRVQRHPSPNRAHSGSQGETRGGFPARDIGRVDRVNSLGTLCIVTFGTAQLNEPLAVAAAHHGENADFA